VKSVPVPFPSTLLPFPFRLHDAPYPAYHRQTPPLFRSPKNHFRLFLSLSFPLVFHHATATHFLWIRAFLVLLFPLLDETPHRTRVPLISLFLEPHLFFFSTTGLELSFPSHPHITFFWARRMELTPPGIFFPNSLLRTISISFTTFRLNHLLRLFLFFLLFSYVTVPNDACEVPSVNLFPPSGLPLPSPLRWCQLLLHSFALFMNPFFCI